MAKKTTVSTSINNDQKVNKKACIKHGVQENIIDPNNNTNLSPLELLQENGGKHKNVDRVMQNLLSVPATCTPSEHVFSRCGSLDTAKRSNILGVLIRKVSIPLHQY